MNKVRSYLCLLYLHPEKSGNTAVEHFWWDFSWFVVSKRWIHLGLCNTG